MNRQHGITAGTYTRLIIDSGAVWKNYGETGQVCLGATRGGNTFNIETEYKEMEADGAKGVVKGSRRITRVTGTLVANFLEISTDILQIALPGSSSTTTGSPASYDVITRALDIALTDYMTNVAIVGEMNGESDPLVLILKNVLADGNLEIAFADNDESVIAVTFTAHFDPASMDAEPWEIRKPIIA